MNAQRRCDCGGVEAAFADGPLSRAQRIAEVIRVAASMPQRNSEAADRLWTHLREGLGDFTFRCCRCRSVCGYPVDFVCCEMPLLIQIDGAVPAAYEARGTVILAECGFRVLRFWSDEVLQRLDNVLAEICRHLRPSNGGIELPTTADPE